MTARVKEKLARGEVVTMANVNYPSPGLVEQIGKLGFDIAFIDCEKGSASFERVEEMCRAARAAGIAAVVRPWSNEEGLVSRLLDIGADGIMAAGISDVASAKSLVEAVRYARYADFEKKLVIAIIESPRGVDALPQLLAVEGVDAWFIGPNDLAHRMGFPGGGQREDVRRTVTAALRTIAASGKTAGTVCRPDEIAGLVEIGARLLMTRVNDLLARGAADFRDRLPASRK